MGCKSSKGSLPSEPTPTSAPITLNVYDLTPLNKYTYWFGIGIYHSGIEAYGLEYGFGAHDYSTSGVFEVEPRKCPGFSYRRSITLGTTNMLPFQFREFIETIAGEYHGDTYHLILKNCNHFTNEVSIRLTGKPIPKWVNRLAHMSDVILLEPSLLGASSYAKPFSLALVGDYSPLVQPLFSQPNCPCCLVPNSLRIAAVEENSENSETQGLLDDASGSYGMLSPLESNVSDIADSDKYILSPWPSAEVFFIKQEELVGGTPSRLERS